MYEYAYASNKNVIWKCYICSSVWKTPLYSRTVGNRGCTKCKVSGTSFPEQYLFLLIKSIYVNVNNRNKSNGFELDIYLPQQKIGIEYNGKYYHSTVEQVKKDNIKDAVCKEKECDL